MSNCTIVAAEVISAFVTNNSIPAAELPDLIRSVVRAFDQLGKAPAQEEPAPKLDPAVPIKKSVHRAYLVSLEDGKRYQTLRRHLGSLGMTPDEYRAKWGLAADYPMTSAAYSAKRSQMSKDLGLGRRKAAEPAEASAATKEPRSTPTAPVKPANPPESVQNAPEAVQEAA